MKYILTRKKSETSVGAYLSRIAAADPTGADDASGRQRTSLAAHLKWQHGNGNDEDEDDEHGNDNDEDD